jgi:hypothetical protein
MRVFDIFNSPTTTKTEDIVETPTVDTETTEMVEEIKNPTDRVTMDVPLLLRIMEYSKEDAKTDMDLHHVVEKLIELSSSGQTLNMNHYNDIMSSLSEAGGSEAEELIKAVTYQPDQDSEPEFKIEKFAIRNPNGLPIVRYRIIKRNGMPAVDQTFDSKPEALKYMRTFFNTEIDEGHGRYWCSTDKRWKERQGPKQSRS